MSRADALREAIYAHGRHGACLRRYRNAAGEDVALRAFPNPLAAYGIQKSLISTQSRLCGIAHKPLLFGEHYALYAPGASD